MVGESNENVFLIQIDTSSFAEFEISEFEISRVDCILFLFVSHFQLFIKDNQGGGEVTQLDNLGFIG